MLSLNLRGYKFLLILFLALLLRVVALYSVPFVDDETNKIMPISKTISLNPRHLTLPLGSEITKHPLLSSYLVKAGTSLFGWNKYGVRLPFVFFSIIGLFFLYRLVEDEFGIRKANLALLLLSLSQYHIGLSRIATTQSLELSFTPIICYIFFRMLRTKDRKWVFLLGVSLGIGFLAKTVIFLLLPIFLIFLGATKEHRFWLREKVFYVVPLLIFVIVSPYLYWSYDNKFVNFRKTLEVVGRVRIGLRPLAFYLGELFPLIGGTSAIDKNCSTEYPFMNWVMGLVAISGVVYSIKQRGHDAVRLLLMIFFINVGISSLVEGPPVYLYIDSFWWAQMSLIPSIILTAHMLVNLRDRYKPASYFLLGLGLYLFLHACFFITIRENRFLPF